MSNHCGGCLHIEAAPHTLRNGRVCCSTCFMRVEEDAAVIRHAENMGRLGSVQARRHYLERVHAAEGEKVRIAVETEFLIAWRKQHA